MALAETRRSSGSIFPTASTKCATVRYTSMRSIALKDYARLESKIQRVPFSGCWIWTAGTRRGGYGQFSFSGELISAHRAAYLMFRGPIAEGQLVCHRCDVRSCINPDHLFLGSYQDNNRDAIRKGRGNRTYGERASKAKLKEAQVIEIRASNLSQQKLGKRYGVSASTISQIKCGRSWRHLLQI